MLRQKLPSFKSIKDLNSDIISWMQRLPRRVDVLVGIPRSGMMVASILSQHFQRPIASLEGFLKERLLESGKSFKCDVSISHKDENLTALILDDTVCKGREMAKAKSKIRSKSIENEILYGAVYTTPQKKDIVDTSFEDIAMPRIFEWNIMRSRYLEATCLDIDGVLCRNPTSEEDDDGDKYENFIRSVNPKHIPQGKVKLLVTNRLEKYRNITEDWLQRHGVRYERLVMANYSTAEARAGAGSYVKDKATAYVSSDSILFIESEKWQAVGIANKAGRPVYCVGTREMIYPKLKGQVFDKVRRIKNRPSEIATLARKAAGRIKTVFQQLT